MSDFPFPFPISPPPKPGLPPFVRVVAELSALAVFLVSVALIAKACGA